MTCRIAEPEGRRDILLNGVANNLRLLMTAGY